MIGLVTKYKFCPTLTLSFFGLYTNTDTVTDINTDTDTNSDTDLRRCLYSLKYFY